MNNKELMIFPKKDDVTFVYFLLNFCTGEPVEEGGKYQIKPDGSLIIRNLDFSDMGNYACLVKNDFGSDKIETFLYPVAVSDLQLVIFSTAILTRKVSLRSFFMN